MPLNIHVKGRIGATQPIAHIIIRPTLCTIRWMDETVILS